MDKFTKEKRSDIMSRVRGKNTKPEEIVRKYLFSKGFRYRKNDKRYPGKPDILLPKYHTAIFINGCFLDILVREYRCSGGTDTANPAAGNRCSGTEIPHLIDCYLRVHSLKAGSNPYTSRIDR